MTISFCSRVAGYFRGDGLVLRNSLISDTSTEGFYVIGSSDVLLERNIFRRNNVEQLTGYYPAAVKIFNQSHRVTCRDNLVIDNPHSNGIWYDVGNRDGVFVNNWVEGALDGFFFEISKGAICRRERVRRLRQGRPRPQQLERARLPQHLRRHRGLLRAQREERGRRPLRLAPPHGARRRRARGARLRGEPAGGERVVPQAAAAVRAAEGSLRTAHPAAGEGGRRKRLRARRKRRAPPRVEPGRRRELPGRARLARGPEEAAAGLRGARPLVRATTSARSSAAPSCAATSSRGRCRAWRRLDDLPADVRRLLGWPEGSRSSPARSRRGAERSTAGRGPASSR